MVLAASAVSQYPPIVYTSSYTSGIRSLHGDAGVKRTSGGSLCPLKQSLYAYQVPELENPKGASLKKVAEALSDVPA